jgi:hypothetical protein
MPKKKPLAEHVVRVALKYPRTAAKLVTFGQFIHDKMDENSATFTHPDPPLAALQLLIEELKTAAAGVGRIGIGGAAIRNVVMRKLIAALMRERAYVETVASADPEHAASIAAMAGMALRNAPSIYKPDFEVRQGFLSGTLDCIAKAIKNAVTYHWQYSFDEGITWMDATVTTTSYTTLTRLPPKTTVTVRFRALLRHSTYTEWSRAVSRTVI